MCAHFLKGFETVTTAIMHFTVSLNCSLMKIQLYTLDYIPAPQSSVGNNEATVTPETASNHSKDEASWVAS